MSEQIPFEIDISNPKEDFKNHLDLDENQRIIFSAPFGSGKTYFLKKYFGEKNPSVFHLYPVNYSVNRNEDIFEFMKYDLLHMLLDPVRELEFEDKEFTLSESIHIKLNDPGNNTIINKVLGYFSKIGIPLDQAYELVPEIEKLLKKPEGISDLKTIAQELRVAEKKKGSIYEFNDITQIIQKLISQTKEKRGEAILIIDDLDRIDPEHIFRLLNVFAAHFDVKADENKFGFDQVIFVCDIDNIRSVFQARYGQSTDFSGYIDKFYSREVFVFDNIDIISDSVKKILRQLKPHDDLEPVFFLNDPNCFDFQVLRDVLQLLVQANQINLRSLLKFVEKEYISPSKPKRAFGYIFNPVNLHLYLVFEFLLKLLGSEKKLLISLEAIKDHEYIHSKTLGTLLLIIDCRNNHFNNTRAPFYLNMFGKRYTYTFNMYSGDRLIMGNCESVVEDTIHQAETKVTHYLNLFLEAAKTLIDLRILRL